MPVVKEISEVNLCNTDYNILNENTVEFVIILIEDLKHVASTQTSSLLPYVGTQPFLK